jgi:hypothetical protein
VVKHRAEIAHIKPVFNEVKPDRGPPMASANENSQTRKSLPGLTGAIAAII